jgi:hypothetical protein
MVPTIAAATTVITKDDTSLHRAGFSFWGGARAPFEPAELTAIMAEIRASGAIKLQAIADELNARGIPSAMGEKWGDKFRVPPSRPDRQAQGINMIYG